MSINRCRDEEIMICPCNGMLLSNEKNEVLIHTITQMNLQIIMLSERSQSKRTNNVYSHLCKILGNMKSIVTELRPVGAWGWKAGGRRDDKGARGSFGEVMDMFIFPIVAMVSRVYIHMSKTSNYTLEAHASLCQLYLTEAV